MVTFTTTNGTFTDTLSNVEGFVLTTGSDTFNGGDGDDIVTGGRGADVLNGGAGADTFIYRASDGADTIDGGTGIDTVQLVSSTIMFLAPTAFANWSNIEIIDASATTLAKIQGTTGADTIDMSAFSQLINVEINGGGGNDTIIGTVGDDRIGGGGADVLTGNGGADTFVFPTQFQSSALFSDTITDMGADDTIDLSSIDANSGLAGDQAFAWIGTDAFSKTGQASCAMTRRWARFWATSPATAGPTCRSSSPATRRTGPSSSSDPCLTGKRKAPRCSAHRGAFTRSGGPMAVRPARCRARLPASCRLHCSPRRHGGSRPSRRMTGPTAGRARRRQRRRW